jgi:hypothetical protein
LHVPGEEYTIAMLFGYSWGLVKRAIYSRSGANRKMWGLG